MFTKNGVDATMLDYCLKQARSLSLDTHKNRLYCVVTNKKGRIIGEASNSYSKTHPKQKRLAHKVGEPLRECLHAELAALIRALQSRQQPYAVWTGRVLRDGTSALAAPCKVCQEAIRLAAVREVHYSM